jgi:hypothetical protein
MPMFRTTLSSSGFVLACVALVTLIPACGDDDAVADLGWDGHVPPSPDGGPRDLGNADLSTNDLGNTDLGTADLGSADLGTTDLGHADLGTADLGTTDLGTADLGSTDLGISDLGHADLGAGTDAGPLAGYRHTITIDGVNDFDAAPERFDTTTAGYSFYVSWDDTSLYFGVDGTDIGSGSSTSWVLVYLDTNGTGLGTTVGVTYNTQTPAMPPGLVADYVFRWRTDDGFQSVQRWNAATSGWVDTAIAPTTFHTGGFVETRLALADLGATGTFSLAALMLNEVALGEWSYAGMPTGTFADGYYASIPMTRRLFVDRSLTANPNAATRLRP